MVKTLLFVLVASIPLIHLSSQIDFTNTFLAQENIIEEMDSVISSGKYENISSVLVAQNGNIMIEKYYNNHDMSSLHNTRSATKSIATLLAGLAIDEGHIDSEEDKIFKYLSHSKPVQNPDPRKDEITIEDLLTMSSVLECDDWNEHSRGHEMKMYFIEDWTQFLVDLPVRAYPFNGPPETRPYGRVFGYASAKSAAIGDIVERAVGMKLDLYLKKKIFQPLEIKDYKFHYSPKGVLNTAGGSEYRSRDLLKMIQLVLNKGRWGENQVISENWIQKATTPHAHAYDEFDYGYLFWISMVGRNNDYQAYYMSGNGGNKVMAIPELGMSIVITSKNYNNRNAHNYSYEIIDKYIIPAVTRK